MKRRLLDWLCCPECQGAFELRVFKEEGLEAIEGLLRCACGAAYPLVDGIPRILKDGSARADKGGQFHRLQALTQRSFGFQWTRFFRMHPAFEANFLNYVAPLTPERFRGRLVLDAGCGFGRHLYYAATYGAEVIGVDASSAVESSYRNTVHLQRAHVVQADLYRLPFKPGTFDLIYSIGVLHHLPEPESAFCNLLRYLKPDGAIAVWVYSAVRRGINACLETVRRLTTRLPLPAVLGLSWLAGVIDWGLFIAPYRLVSRWRLTRALADRVAWPRVKLYAAYSFDVCVADWMDRLAAPVRFYYTPDQLRQWCQRGALLDIQISPTGHYGWRVAGRTPVAHGGAVSVRERMEA